MICKHCHLAIAPILDPWGGQHGFHHVAATDNSDGKYATSCVCKCDACKPDTTLSFNDPCPADCIDGEEAEPESAVTLG